MALAASCGTPPFSVFSCLYIYVYVFDGDVTSWQAFLRHSASRAQIDADGPLVAKLAASLRERPELADQIRAAIDVIDQLAERFAES